MDPLGVLSPAEGLLQGDDAGLLHGDGKLPRSAALLRAEQG